MIIILSEKHFKKVKELLYKYMEQVSKIDDLEEKYQIHEIIGALNFSEKENR